MTVDNDWWEMEGRSFVPVVWFLDERQACIQKAGVRHRVCSDDIIEHCLHRQAVLYVIYKKLSQAVNLEKRTTHHHSYSLAKAPQPCCRHMLRVLLLLAKAKKQASLLWNLPVSVCHPVSAGYTFQACLEQMANCDELLGPHRCRHNASSPGCASTLHAPNHQLQCFHTVLQASMQTDCSNRLEMLKIVGLHVLQDKCGQSSRHI